MGQIIATAAPVREACPAANLAAQRRFVDYQPYLRRVVAVEQFLALTADGDAPPAPGALASKERPSRSLA